MILRVALAVTVSLAALSAQAQAPSTQTAPATPLGRLFKASDEASLARNPVSGLFRGDLRRAGEFGDYITDAYIAREKAAIEADLKALAGIDRARLSASEQLSYDTFQYSRGMDLAGYAPAILAATVVRPIDHFNSWITFFPDLSSGEGVAPFKTAVDYENGLKRIDGYVLWIDRAIARFREGQRSGVVQPRITIERLIAQLDGDLKAGVEGSTFAKPVRAFPAAVPASEQARLRAAYHSAVRTKLVPAYTRLRDYLRTEYLPASRTAIGLAAMPGGPALYAYLVRQQTTTDLTPDAIHRIGLSEVARITAEMDAIRRQVGFKGDLKAFFAHLRTDPRFKPASKQALGDMYRAVEKRVALTIPKLFTLTPKSRLEIRPVPEFLEANQAGAYYQPGTPDGSRPGVFYYNTYDLPSRTTPGVETLYLHEGVPGHHFQIALAQEDASLPPFQRFGGPTAFFEGWALYAESLGPELGLFTDPYQAFGRLDDEMLRAMRLVVDTGIHAKGWSRDKAIAYMLDNSSQGKTDAVNEVDRYVVIPGQALGYKIGQLKIRELRARAEAKLGARFDIRAFHAEVLNTGALPLTVLEAKIDRWIAGHS